MSEPGGEEREHACADQSGGEGENPDCIGVHVAFIAVGGAVCWSPVGHDGQVAPIGFAHRGARAECRENTLEAFARALELGATGLESDAWITADGVAVLDHDGLVGPPWRRRRIADVARADLPRHIPALQELFASFRRSLRALPGREGSGRAGPDSVRGEIVPGRASTVAVPPRPVHARGLAALRALVAAGALDQAGCRVPLPPGAVPGGRADAQGRAEAIGWAAYLEDAKALGLDVVNLRSKEWERAAVAEVHSAGLLAFGWGAHKRPEIDRVLGLGLDGIYSDHPEVAMSAIRSSYRGVGDSEGPDTTEGPDDEERSPDDELLRDRPDDP